MKFPVFPCLTKIYALPNSLLSLCRGHPAPLLSEPLCSKFWCLHCSNCPAFISVQLLENALLADPDWVGPGVRFPLFWDQNFYFLFFAVTSHYFSEPLTLYVWTSVESAHGFQGRVHTPSPALFSCLHTMIRRAISGCLGTKFLIFIQTFGNKLATFLLFGESWIHHCLNNKRNYFKLQIFCVQCVHLFKKKNR